MHKTLILGAGKIGRMAARLLKDSSDYDVTVADCNPAALQVAAQLTGAATLELDVNNASELTAALRKFQFVVSALSYRFSAKVAESVLSAGASYFDLTEDVAATRCVREIAANAAANQVFAPMCGLAPGFISIVANHLTTKFETLESVRMRAGALPQFPTDALKYNLTWSTDGLINEYCNPCDAIHHGKQVEVLPLEGLENFSLDGDRYEAFNTSGGLGTLCETLAGRLRELNFKTIRYQGHRDLISFLINDLRLGDRRELLKEILEQAIPITYQDVAVTFCTVTGWRNGQLIQVSDARKIYCQRIGDEIWSAIQVSTAAAVCAMIDLHREGKLPGRGFIRQEDVSFHDFCNNRFGQYFDSGNVVAFESDLD